MALPGLLVLILLIVLLILLDKTLGLIIGVVLAALAIVDYFWRKEIL